MVVQDLLKIFLSFVNKTASSERSRTKCSCICYTDMKYNVVEQLSLVRYAAVFPRLLESTVRRQMAGTTLVKLMNTNM